MTLRLALVGGPMYDGLYRVLRGRDVEVVVHADHPTLNREVARLLTSGERVDVLSTHSKYAPSQRAWLRPLDGLVDVAGLAPGAVDLCRFEGQMLCAPRNIDVRIAWVNTRLVSTRPVPSTWTELADSDVAFGFPGRESGLFGTFFELVVANGGALFEASGRPTLDTPASRRSLETLQRLGTRVARLTEWHYDEVDAALGDGTVALAAAWPGATATLRASREGESLEPHPYLAGPQGVRSYAGCHGWAIPTTCGDVDGAQTLVQELCSAEANAVDAASGSVCAHVAAFAATPPADDLDARRRAILASTIADGMITYPPMERFPEIEDAGWTAIRGVLLGEHGIDAALAHMQRVAERVSP